MSVGSEKTREFVKRIEILIASIEDSQTVKDSAGDELNEKEYLRYIINNASDLLNHGEWLIALEDLLDNLAEVNYKLDIDIWSLAKSASLYAPKDWAYEKLLTAAMRG